MTVELASWNLEQANIDIAHKLIKAHPGRGRKWYAKELGCSERTLFRWVADGKIFAPPTHGKEGRAIDILKKAGYLISKGEIVI